MAGGYRSGLAYWIGGASSPPGTSGGNRSMLAPWMGGAAAVPTGTKGGFRSMHAFWMGGACNLTATPTTGERRTYQPVLTFGRMMNR